MPPRRNIVPAAPTPCAGSVLFSGSATPCAGGGAGGFNTVLPVGDSPTMAAPPASGQCVEVGLMLGVMGGRTCRLVPVVEGAR